MFNLLQSYLSNRMIIKCTKLNNKVSNFRTIKYGIPQNSVLGPILFLLYVMLMTSLVCLSFQENVAETLQENVAEEIHKI